MRVPFLDLRSQYVEIQSAYEPVLHEILQTGAYVMGKHNKGLEEELAAMHHVKHGIAVNSGTDALRIMLQAAGIGAGDEVITSAFSFVATIETIIQAGARPVFVDIDPVSFCIDPNLVEAAITERTRAIMPVHLFGQLCDIRALQAIAEKRGLITLEDAAQAIENKNGEDFAGSFGLAAGLSFYVTKNLGAAGDGGLILTNDDAIAEKCKSLRIHGMGKERYYYDDIGFTSRMAEIQAAFLQAKLARLSHWTARRQQIADRFNKAFEATSVTAPVTLPGNNHTWHQYTVRSTRRDEMQAFLKEREIDSMIYYPVPFHYHEPYKYLGYSKGDLPETERASLEVLSLPVHPHLTDEQVAWVIQSVVAFAGTVHA